MSNEDTLIHFNRCGFDFYTMHPYSPSFERAQKSAQMLCDKPLLFTEWGGHYVYDNPGYLRESIRKMAALYHQNSDDGALAGAFLWCWADYYDFNRGAPCVCGELFEGIVTQDRQKHLCYDAFCEELAEIEKEPAPSAYVYTSLDTVSGQPLTCVDGDAGFDAVMADILNEARATPFYAMRQRRIKIGPRTERAEIAGMSATPSVLDGGRLTYTCGRTVSQITLAGLTSPRRGYPIGGELGEEVAVVRIFAEDGVHERVLRNGREVTTAYATLASSRIDPRADLAPRLAEFSYDQNFEKYVINRLDLTLACPVRVDRVEIESRAAGYQLLMYGIFGE
jgi:hypothetical protein